MSTFAVTAERLTILPHPNADALELAAVGGYRAVVTKDKYRTGDFALYIPEQAILPDALIEELGLTGRLAGKAANRVKAVRLRGELSQGIVCRPAAVAGYDLAVAYSREHDFAPELGISKWIPEVPANMSGEMIAAPRLLPWIEIENIKRYPDIFTAGEPVTATEKLHGCLSGRTRILMPDYSYRTIASLVDEEYRGEVMGMDSDGRIVPTPVLNTFRNGKTDDWVKVTVDRLGIGRGSSFGAVVMTPNHQVWSPQHFNADTEGYVDAAQLKAGDEIWLHRTEVSLTPLAEQVLIGKLLGDGYFHNRPASAAIQFGHAAKDESYVHWTNAMLGPMSTGNLQVQTSGYGTAMLRSGTIYSSLIKDAFAEWETSQGKQVPESAVDKIGPIALAFWYMDDGSLGHDKDQEDRANFATNGFDFQSIERLQQALLRFGIQSTAYNIDGWRLRLNADAAETLFLLVSPYIPASMQRKLPARYRMGEAGFPRIFGDYKPFIRPQRVKDVKRVFGVNNERVNPRGSERYDLQTDTANFFANGMLVHNSATLTTLDRAENRLFVSSKGFGGKRLAIKEDVNNLYWRAIRVHGVEAALHTIAERLGAVRFGLFGEVFGTGVQDLTYGIPSRNEPGFAIFDAMVETHGAQARWLDQDELRTLCEATGLIMVPALYAGPYNYEFLTSLAEGIETFSGRSLHLREGLVVRPQRERYSEILGGRAIAKFVSAAYLTRKGNVTEFE